MSGPAPGTTPPAGELRVKVADHAVARGPDVVIATIGLGSCVAIVLWHERLRIGGLAHVLLPSQTLSRDVANRAKFAETAVPLLVEEMTALGARPGELTARLVGGASMFGQLLPSSGINMGERNVDASRLALRQAGIRVVAEDVGRDYGRSVYFHLDDGRVRVRSLKMGDVHI